MKKTKTILLTLILLLGMLLLHVYITFGYGSYAGFLAELKTMPEPEKLDQYRAAASQQLTQAQAELASLPGLTLHKTTWSDACAQGEHNWKRDDPYAHLCSYRWTYYYGTNREYKDLLLELETALANAGWTIQVRSPQQPTLRAALDQSSGDLVFAPLPVYQKTSGRDRLLLTINRFDGYGGDWTVDSHEPAPFGFGIGLLQQLSKSGSNISPAEIFKQITASGQSALMIAISQVYFEN